LDDNIPVSAVALCVCVCSTVTGRSTTVLSVHKKPVICAK